MVTPRRARPHPGSIQPPGTVDGSCGSHHRCGRGRTITDISQALTLLKSHFGYDTFRPHQDEVVTSALQGNDALVVMPTGSGKSLCYQLPALCFDGLTLVVSPLIALMKDQVDGLNANGVPAGFINSSLGPSERDSVQNEALAGRLKLLYIAPERLALSGFRRFLDSLKVSLIAIDEAHCISEWGHDFRPDYRNLQSLRQQFPGVPVMALTATATERVREDIVAQLQLRTPTDVLASFNRENLTYRVVPKSTAFSDLVTLLRRHEGEAAIVYCFSRKDTEQLAADLKANGMQALPYHAGMEADARRKTQERFIRDDVPIIVATIAFGMGIDKPDVRLVVHRDLPKSIEGYYQETGRAGRDGLPAECVLFYSYGDRRKHAFFIDDIEDPDLRATAERKLNQVLEYCEVQTCRRRHLLEYFGETWPEDSCDGCDNCLTQTEEFDATEIAQKVLSAVVRTGERFGEGHVNDVLRGRGGKRTQQFGHDKLPVFGIARDYTQDGLREIVRLLTSKGLLVRNGDKYPTLALSSEGRRFLKERSTLTLAVPKADAGEVSVAGTGAIHYHQALFDQLRALRKRIADERGVPPYVIFHDASLREMASRLPQSPDSFTGVSGVGRRKLEEFSDAFIQVIRGFAEENGLTETTGPGAVSPAPRRAPRADATYDRTRELLPLKLTIEQMAGVRELSVNTIINHIGQLVSAGGRVDIDYLMPPPDRFARIEAAFRDVGSLEYLTPVRDVLGEEYSFDELRLVRIAILARGSAEVVDT